MGIGIGGSLGPLRLGVSTRGIGGGIGPLSVGTGWRRRRRSSGTGGGLFAGVVLLFLAASWPYLLGTWIAVERDAASPSFARSATGWTFEGAFIVLVVWFLLARAARSERWRAAREAEARLTRAQEEAAAACQLARAVRDDPLGIRSPAVPAKQRLLLEMAPARLIEPRSESRGGPKVPTAVGTGHLLITDTELVFVGTDRSVKWQYGKVLDVHAGKDFVTFRVANRQLISGVSVGSARQPALLLALRWASAVANHASLDEVEQAANELERTRVAYLEELTQAR